MDEPQGLTEEFIEERWTEFKEKFNKNYADEDEEKYRKGLFITSLKMIEDHNDKYENGLVNYKMGITQYCDYAKKEMPTSRR